MRSTGSKILAVTTVLVLTFALLAGCASSPPSPVVPDPTEPKGGGHLVLAWMNDVPTWDMDRTTWTELPQVLIYDNLISKDFDGNISPYLAKSWDISADGLTWTFMLREDVTFSNGNRFDAHSVVYKFNRMKSPEMPPTAGRSVTMVNTITALDDFTVEFKLDYPDPVFWDALSRIEYMDPEVAETLGEDFGQNPVGTGAWLIDEYVSGSHLTLIRRDDYNWGAEYWENTGAPHLEKITFRFMPDETTRLLELEQGSVDFAVLPPGEVARLQTTSGVNVEIFPSTGIRYWGFNHKKWPWTDNDVRRAMQYAINKHALAEYALEGLGQALWSGLPPSIAGFSEEVEAELQAKYPYDPAKSREVLESTGWVRGSDGIYARDGKKFSVDMWVLNDPLEVRVAEMIKDNLSDIGVNVDIMIVEQARLTADTPQGLHESLIWRYGYTDPKILHMLFFPNGGTRMHHHNDELVDLLTAGHMTVITEERMEYYHAAQRLLGDINPWVVLYFPEVTEGWTTRVQGVRYNPHRSNLIIINDIKIVE